MSGATGAFRQSWITLVVAVVVMLAALTGTAQGQAVRNPDTLIIARTSDPETLDFAYGYDPASSEIYLWHIYETLIFFNGSATGAFVPMLATEVPSLANGGISNGGKTYTFKLRDGVKFHDGSALTADDVKYSLLRFMFMDRDGGPSELLLAAILDAHGTRDDKGVLKSGLFAEADRAIQVRGNTISITLKKPFAPFMAIMAMWSMTTSKKWAAARGDWDGTAAGLTQLNNPKKPEDPPLFSKTNGTGPFKLARWDRQGRQAILERNDAYWRKPAALRRIVVRVVEDFGARRLMLQQGDADIITVNRTEQTQVEGVAGVRIVDDLSQMVTQGIYMSMKIDTAGNPDVGSGRLDGNGIPADFFADVNVRKGIAQAFDYNSATRDCYRGKAVVGNGPVPKGLFGYIPTGKWYGYDPARAAAAFREARGGQVWNTGFRFGVLFNTGNLSRQCQGQILKTGIEALNPRFRVDVRSVTFPRLLQGYRASRLPMFMIGWVAHFPPDADNFVTSFQHSTGTYSSAQGYGSPEVDKLIEQARFETDRAKRRAMYARLQETAFNDVTTLYLYTTGFITLRSWVRGWYHNPAFPAPYYYPMSKQ